MPVFLWHEKLRIRSFFFFDLFHQWRYLYPDHWNCIQSNSKRERNGCYWNNVVLPQLLSKCSVLQKEDVPCQSFCLKHVGAWPSKLFLLRAMYGKMKGRGGPLHPTVITCWNHYNIVEVNICSPVQSIESLPTPPRFQNMRRVSGWQDK